MASGVARVLLFAAVLLSAVLLLLLQVAAASPLFVVTAYGAVGDGTTNDQTAIAAAVAAAEAAGGGVVEFPAPGQYLTAPFNVTGANVELRVASGAAVLGVQNATLYPVIAALPSYGNGRELPGPRYQALVLGVGARNLTLTGGGVVDGQGAYWWALAAAKTLQHTRPGLFECMYCSGVQLLGPLTLRDSGFWTVHPVYSDAVLVDGVRIEAPPTSPNTDGIDPDSSSNVEIRNCVIECGDDNISVKSGYMQWGRAFGRPAVNISVHDNEFGPGGNGMAVGSEIAGGVANVSFVNNRLRATAHGVSIKAGRGMGGYVRDVRFVDNHMTLIGAGLEVNMLFEKGPPGNATTTPRIDSVLVANSTGDALQAGVFDCLIESPCNMTLRAIDWLTVEDWQCQEVIGQWSDVKPAPCF